jgi:hypothetical protein
MKISKSYYSGFARALDLGATVNKRKRAAYENGFERDRNAIRRDWENVGRGIEREARKHAVATRG